MMTHRNGYAYDSKSAIKIQKTRWDRRCIHCRGLIFKGEEYTKWRGYNDMPEHHPECLKTPEENKRRESIYWDNREIKKREGKGEEE